MVAARNRDVAFIVLLAGTGLPGDRIVVEQVRTINAASGVTGQQLEESTARHREIVEILKSEPDDGVFAQKVREPMTGRLSEVEINTAIALGHGTWGRYFIAYDPATALRKVTCPVLALIGEKDTQFRPLKTCPRFVPRS